MKQSRSIRGSAASTLVVPLSARSRHSVSSDKRILFPRTLPDCAVFQGSLGGSL